jgi:heme ABC exporter ATP-binding subunit CcmA
VDLSVEPGSLQLILGPNGAGKTTLLRILAGLTRPSAGVVRIDGRSLREAQDLRRCIGLLSHQSFLYDDLTPLENLTFVARLYDIPGPAEAAREAVGAVGLTERMHEPMRRLSRGMVQRVAIARALIHQPSILLLDEPFTGLDPRAAEQLVAMLSARLAARTGVVLVTHSPGEAWSLATRVSVLVRGRWVIDEPRPDDRHAFMSRVTQAFGD